MQRLYLDYKYIWEQLDNTMDSLFAFIQQYPMIRMDKYGNITVANVSEKDSATVPVFCCHMDTVHTEEPSLELIKEDVLMSMDGGGVGGDDKCGIVACLELLKRVPCKCIFFRDEETGCRGSKEYDQSSLKDNLFCIEIDRRGSSDLIFSACRGQMCSLSFQERVKKAFPHGEAANGSLTDVCVLDEAGINMMNLSAGYYRPHTDKEYVVLSELQRNIDCLVALVEDLRDNPLKDNSYTRSRTVYGSYFHKDGRGHRSYQEAQAAANASAGEDDYLACQYGTGYKRGGRNDGDADYPELPFGAASRSKK